MRRSRLAAARAGHVRKRGQPCGRQRNVGSPRGPHLMVSTSMVYTGASSMSSIQKISVRNVPERSPRHAPGFPAFTALRSAGGEERGCEGYVSRLLFRALRERRITLGWVGDVAVAATDPHHKLPLAYLRESLLVLHLQLLFQGGVEFPTGGKSGGAKGAPWRR